MLHFVHCLSEESALLSSFHPHPSSTSKRPRTSPGDQHWRRFTVAQLVALFARAPAARVGVCGCNPRTRVLPLPLDPWQKDECQVADEAAVAEALEVADRIGVSSSAPCEISISCITTLIGSSISSGLTPPIIFTISLSKPMWQERSRIASRISHQRRLRVRLSQPRWRAFIMAVVPRSGQVGVDCDSWRRHHHFDCDLRSSCIHREVRTGIFWRFGHVQPGSDSRTHAFTTSITRSSGWCSSKLVGGTGTSLHCVKRSPGFAVAREVTVSFSPRGFGPLIKRVQ